LSIIKHIFFSKRPQTILLFFLFISIGLVQQVSAQILPENVSPSQVSTMTADELNEFVRSSKQKGYTAEQIKALALSSGVSASQIAIAEKKMSNETKGTSEVATSLNISEPPSVGFSNNSASGEMTKNPLFGYDFFNNQNISFQPNMNLATPESYQLGPGDALVISIWGAAENTYDVEVNRNGLIKLPNIGPVVVSGMSIKDATIKIKNALKKVYAGISAPDSSPYKIFTNVSMSSVRTVQVNIIGQVKVPGTYSLSALSTVLNALYASGGPTMNGTFREVKLVRNGEEVSYFDIYKYLIDGSQEGNKTLQDQDVIIVGAYTSIIKINGAVKRPGTYEIKSSETLEDLIEFVSGFTSSAYRDVIKLKRIDGDRMKIKEIDYVNSKGAPLLEGDVITVGSIIDKIENKITISGAVYRAGDFEYIPNISLLQLIEKASGITETAYLERGLITRQDNEGALRTRIAFSVGSVLNGEENIVLQPNDVVQIFDESVVQESGTISIAGAVNEPKSIQFVEGLTLEDLVILAQGYGKRANSKVIEVTREIIDEDYKTVNHIFKISAEQSLGMSNNTAFVFKPNDKIFVMYLSGSAEQSYAFIEGEVNYPGQYYAEYKNEKILDLIKRAGGLSPYAFVDGATLIRQNPYYKEKALSITAKSINIDDNIDDDIDNSNIDDINIDINNKREFRLGIDLRKIIAEGDNSKHNLVLKNGDVLFIPSVKQTVKVEGEVLLPSLVRYNTGENLLKYINKSGGFTSEAKQGKIYVIYPNGDISSTKHFFFFRTFPKIKPGSIVLVPKKQERLNSWTTQEIIGGTSGAATLALLIQQILK
jgi:protein involved in polysaccharide export with SLBB domain